MDLILQHLVNALALSAVYALVAIGISLFFGVIGIVNLAHGDIATLGVFASLAVFQFLLAGGAMDITALSAPAAMATLAALAAGLVVAALSGVVFYRVAFFPLRAAPPIIGLLCSVGVGFIIRESILNFYPNGRNPQPFPAIIPPDLIEIGGVIIQYKHIFVIGTAVIVMFALAYCVERTRFGRAMRSILNNREVAQSLGVSTFKVTVALFALGSALAGLAGLMNALYYNLVQSDMGTLLTVKGFTAAVIGGLGNIYGALLGAVLVGLIEAVTAGFIPDGSAYKDVAVFGVLIAILIARPNGLLGRLSAERV
ncbi:branched-chain amino acid ABC transporter permease [Reyranella sp. CPCC 100927]|uniref:branched-chain amino acid ABC transporter permease n=1 Tax=Reyranella sp. CPCC 100927 TaxID=2599616 RepID=UPI0011B6CCDA|nr:branched-chain amino acid ABC transporter permease [Reyranella sp. CPCC 100927]TWS97600.1 branched-chain amino acid ABC transporter permease [Reyranella sp. CPCC 100927]